MNKPFSNPEIRKLKALAQRLDPVLRIGREGIGDTFLKSVEDALELHELIKIKFTAHKEEKRELAAQLAEKTSSFLVAQVGHVAVIYRARTDPAKRKVVL